MEKVIIQLGEDFDDCLAELSAGSRDVHGLPKEATETWPLDLFAASRTVVASHVTRLMRFEFAFYPLSFEV